MKNFLFVPFFILALWSCDAQPQNNFSISFSKDRTELPIQYRSGASPVVYVMVNGKGPYKFLFDTGSPGIAKLDTRLFEELKLTVTDSVWAGDGSGNRIAFPVTTIETIQIGDYTINHTHAMVRNYNSRPGVDSIDGVIGMAFFDNVTVELNFENNKLIINKGKLSAGSPGVMASPYINGVPGVKVKLGDKEFNSIFDTGNMGGLTFLSSDIPTEIMAGEPRVTGRAQTVSSSFEIKEVALNTAATIGTIIFDKPTIIMNDMLRQSNIGIRFAKQMNITFDKTNQLVRLVRYTPNASAIATIVQGNNSAAGLQEYTGQYGDRSISLGADGFLYIQRPNGMLLKMVPVRKDEFTLENIKGALFAFVRSDSHTVTGIKVSRDSGANWEVANKEK